MHRVVVRYAASRRHTQRGACHGAAARVAEQANRVTAPERARNTQLVSWEDVAGAMKATPFRGSVWIERGATQRRRATNLESTLERVRLPLFTETAERAVVPRAGASNDGKPEADTEPRSASNTGVASAT